MPLLEYQMAKHRRSTQQCVNTKMPEELTEQFREKIQGLRSFPKGDYLKTEVFSKYVSSDTDPAETRKLRAITKWLAVERDNEATNDRLFLTPSDFQIMPRVSFESFMSFARDIISDIIGVTAPVDALIGTFSGGASTSRPRTHSYPAGKYLGKAHVTPRCLELFEGSGLYRPSIDGPLEDTSLYSEMPGWFGDGSPIDIVVVPGNVMFTVPKKTDIDRCACKEPDLNMFVQKGIGSYFRTCLRRNGVNLNDQSINRSFARSGSLTGELATFDLSSASDSVSTELVAQLLPECWYTLLDSVRSHVTIIDGEEHSNHMFSSMGNGFTFELESLLFYAIVRSICFFSGTRGVVSIYGDDIICPTGISHILPYVFGYLGFTVNLEKSFVSGDIRESCGGHYQNGRDITPFYVKAPISTLVDVIDVANKLRRWAEIEDYSILDPEVEEIWLWLKSFVPSHLWGGGDTTFKYQLTSHDVSSHRLVEETKRSDNGTGGYYHWLNATWDRTVLRDGVTTSSRTESRPIYRSRSVRQSAVPRLPALFNHELG